MIETTRPHAGPARSPAGVIALTLALGLLACVSPLSRAVTPNAITAPPDTSAVYEALERGRQALLADKYEEASKAVDEALKKPEFVALPKSAQYRAFLFAAIAAQGRKDYLGAHEFASIASDYPDANGDIWVMRTRYAYWVDNYADAGASLTTVAKQWPKSLSELTPETVMHIVYNLRDDRKLGAERLELIKALFEVRFTSDWGMQPSGFWRELALDALDHHDTKRAAAVLARVTSARTLINMRTDRRFDALVQAEPKSFDVAAAAQGECKGWKRVMDANPRKLGPVVQYMYALLAVGNYQDIVTLADRALAKQAKGTRDKPAFEDEEDQLNWIHDLKSQGLRGLGRWDDALAVQVKAHEMRETSSDKVSQAINLGFTYTVRNEPAEALKALEGVDWARSLSGYGRMQFQQVRLRAYLEQDNRTEAEKIYAYMRENKSDAPDTWQDTMMDWGDLDGAAALYITRLHDPEERDQALYSAQTFLDRPRLPRELEDRARWEKFLARDDVAAAIAEVGRREKQPVYDLWN